MKRLRKSIVAGLISVAAVAAGLANAAYPEKTINYIIAFGPGGESDVSARLQEPFFKKLTGQTVAIQYKAGAGGAAAWSQINSAPGDGYSARPGQCRPTGFGERRSGQQAGAAGQCLPGLRRDHQFQRCLIQGDQARSGDV